MTLATPKMCSIYKESDHVRDDSCSKDDRKEGQEPPQIARRQIFEAENAKTKSESKDKGNGVHQVVNRVFYTSHVARDDTLQSESSFFACHFWSYVI